MWYLRKVVSSCKQLDSFPTSLRPKNIIIIIKYYIIFTDESVKRQITDSISENLTDSDLESA